MLKTNGFFKKFKTSIGNLFLGKKEIDKDILNNLKTILITSDLGIDLTNKIIEKLTDKVNRKLLTDQTSLLIELEKILINILEPSQKDLDINIDNKPFIILTIGINGAGKTTTLGKLAKKYTNENKKVMLAAGDTFRAAAISQLQAWGDKNNIPVVAQKHGADSASVIFDAIQSAKAKNIDLLLADTAGRLHTQDHLIKELKKVIKVIKKLDETAPHEILLVLDASIGQNALNQAITFNESLNVTGIAMTKLDGTAKGGIIFAIADKLKLPIRYIGTGEKIEDLNSFNAKSFVASLLKTTENID